MSRCDPNFPTSFRREQIEKLMEVMNRVKVVRVIKREREDEEC